MKRKYLGLLAGTTMLSTLLLAPGATLAQTTEVGTPRDQTIIVDMLNGTIANPELMNPYVQGTDMVSGVNNLLFSPLWEIDTTTGEQFPYLAAEMPEVLDDTFTRFRVRLREGITWSDGTPFTADDVIFTAQMLTETDGLPTRAFFTNLVSGFTKVDDYTIDFETFEPQRRFTNTMGSMIFGSQFRIVPQHIWENEDPTTFNNFPPVTTSAYVYGDHDPNGNWVLWERREDWQSSDVGVLAGEPVPHYVLFRFYGPEERRILAMLQDDLDILMDISADGWAILNDRSDNVEAWFDHFPWANLDDPCERGIHFNTTRPPYDQWQVRWALALATDIQDVSVNTFSGMLRVSPLAAPPIQVLMETYHIPMLPWLEEFALPDGYQPFDSSVAGQLADRLAEDGVEGLPESAEELQALFGVGWWRHDPEQAARLLESVGFSRDGDQWLLPDGEPWTIIINAPADFEVLSQRLAFAVANEWNDFGITTEVQQLQGGPFWTQYNTGEFEMGSYWWPSSCAVAPDLYLNLETWHERYVVPNGEATGINRERFSTPEMSALIDQITALPPDDPEVIELWTQVLQILVENLPAIDMVGTSKFVPVNTTYWDNFPSATNYYEGPWWWWTQFKWMLTQIEPASAS